MAQLDRGDKFESAREKCWDHILLELRYCGGSVDGLGFDFSKLVQFDEFKEKASEVSRERAKLRGSCVH